MIIWPGSRVSVFFYFDLMTLLVLWLELCRWCFDIFSFLYYDDYMFFFPRQCCLPMSKSFFSKSFFRKRARFISQCLFWHMIWLLFYHFWWWIVDDFLLFFSSSIKILRLVIDQPKMHELSLLGTLVIDITAVQVSLNDLSVACAISISIFSCTILYLALAPSDDILMSILFLDCIPRDITDVVTSIQDIDTADEW